MERQSRFATDSEQMLIRIIGKYDSWIFKETVSLD